MFSACLIVFLGFMSERMPWKASIAVKPIAKPPTAALVSKPELGSSTAAVLPIKESEYLAGFLASLMVCFLLRTERRLSIHH